MSGRSPLRRAGGPAGGGKHPGEGRSVGCDGLQSFLIKLIKFFRARSAPPPPAHPSRAPRGPPRTPLGGWGRVGAGGGASPSGSPPRKPTFPGGRYPGVRAQTPVQTGSGAPIWLRWGAQPPCGTTHSPNGGDGGNPEFTDFQGNSGISGNSGKLPRDSSSENGSLNAPGFL